jgi:ubiquinone/menaquinone biosynthesis C-methylase UbiE
MNLTQHEWHDRFTQQALWTLDLRDYLYKQIGIEKIRSLLEVGCGTGAILADFSPSISTQNGLDIDRLFLDTATQKSPKARFTQGDAHYLPYAKDCFDLTFCHFLLLWIAEPGQVITEMARVTRPGGSVLAMAEPDYGGRIDFPQELNLLGQWQMKSLREQGADPCIGRKLAQIFTQAGLQFIQTGVIGGQWSGSLDWDQWESEWKVLEFDLKIITKNDQILDITKLKAIDKTAYEQGARVLFVPTFYAVGRVPPSPK